MNGISEPRSTEGVSLALLILRITLGIFLVIWAVDKFVNVEPTGHIWQKFYHLQIGASASYVAGALELLLAVAVILGLCRRVVYGAAFVVHAVSTFSTWNQLLNPWAVISGHHVNILFHAAIPVLAGFLVLYLLRDWDKWSLSGWICEKFESLV